MDELALGLNKLYPFDICGANWSEEFESAGEAGRGAV